MSAVTQARKARAAMNARKSLYAIRIYPQIGSYEWRLYTADLRILLAAGVHLTRHAAEKDAENALRVRVEYPEDYAHEIHEKAAA